MSRPQQRGSLGFTPLLLWGPRRISLGCTRVTACSVSRGSELVPPGRTCRLPFCLAAVLNTLRHLSTTTSILTDPSQLEAGSRGCHQNQPESRGVLAALSGHVADGDAEETLPARGEEAAPLTSPTSGPLLSLLWPQPLRMLRSGLKQVWVLPTAIAQLWEPLAVNSDSVTQSPTSPRLREAQMKGNEDAALPVLSCWGVSGGWGEGHGTSAGSQRAGGGLTHSPK